MTFHGHYAVNATVTIPWSTNAANGAAITRSTNGSIRIYKNGGTTERASASGITDTEDFDSVTGCHMLTIDTSDNAVAGFYADGSVYEILLYGAIIDGQTVNTWLGSFAIGPVISDTTKLAGNTAAATRLKDNLLLCHTGAVQAGTPTTATWITNLTSSENNAYLGRYLFFDTGANAGLARSIVGYVGATKTITVEVFPAVPTVADTFVII